SNELRTIGRVFYASGAARLRRPANPQLVLQGSCRGFVEEFVGNRCAEWVRALRECHAWAGRSERREPCGCRSDLWRAVPSHVACDDDVDWRSPGRFVRRKQTIL